MFKVMLSFDCAESVFRTLSAWKRRAVKLVSHVTRVIGILDFLPTIIRQANSLSYTQI